MKQRTLSGLIAGGLIIIMLVIKFWITTVYIHNPQLSQIVAYITQYLFFIPVVYFVILALIPQKSIGIIQLTIAIVLYVVVSNLPDEWSVVFYKIIATIIGGLTIWLLRHKIQR